MLFLPSPNISHFSKKPRFLSVGNVLETKLLEPRVSTGSSGPQQTTGTVYMHTHVCAHTDTHKASHVHISDHDFTWSLSTGALPALPGLCLHPFFQQHGQSSHCNPVIYPQCLQSCFAHFTVREKHYSECVFTFPHPTPQTVGRTDGIQISTEPHRNLH